MVPDALDTVSTRDTPAHALRLAALAAVLWTLAIAGSLLWNIHIGKEKSMELAYAEARAVRDKDMAFRRWGLRHSGVYVPTTEKELPSPYLAHVPGRDVVTTDGKHLTLRAPATMVREMMDEYAGKSGLKGRIVGLRFLNPANAPDAWERKQLEDFEMGGKAEAWEIADMDGKPHLRYLKAWFMEPGCVRCHDILGYRVGDLGGATGVNLPLEPYLERASALARELSLTHGAIWLIGLCGISWAGRQGHRRAKERRAAVEHIEYLAHHDSLTGLANRYSMENRLAQALATARRIEGQLAVMLIDMDRFKNINDTLGHHVGDELLIEVAHRLRDDVRASDIVARLGGDEFVVVLTGMEAAQDAMRVGAKILDMLGQPYVIEGQLLHSTPSIGISVFPADGDDAETLLKHADTAMYYAKEHGRNSLRFFTADLTAAAAERMTLERDLRAALLAGRLVLHYQPQIEAGSDKLRGFEALARWPHETRGLIPPAQFIPIAEESGLIEPLGDWVLDSACRQAKAWREAGAAALQVAVNLSPHQLRSVDLVARVKATLEKHALPPDALELEVTESTAMADPEHAIAQLGALRALGVTIAIDDFGTGYSSLAYLSRLPAQVLKIDRAFVRDIETDVHDATICSATILLAKSLGLQVVAEGVETAAQADFLWAHDCDWLQGYLVGKPLPPEDCLAWLKPA